MTETTAIAAEVFRQLSGGNKGHETASYVAVPGNGAARWLLPTGRPAIGILLASWSPYRLRSRVAWSAVRAATKIGGLARAPGTAELRVECPRTADWAALGWRAREAPVPVIYLGTPGSRRKAVVHLVEHATGKCQAVVKIPLTEQAKITVLREAEVLEALAAEGFEQAPRVLYADAASGVASQTFVEGRSGSRKLNTGTWPLLRSLILPGETASLSSHAQRLSLETVDSAEDLGVARVLDRLSDDSLLPACWQHGDFAPWNIKRQSDGRCSLVDWEDARRNSLPLQDAFHFLHVQDFLFRANPTLHAQEIYLEASSMGISARQCHKLEAVYLVDALVNSTHTENHKRQRFVSTTLGLWQRYDA